MAEKSAHPSQFWAQTIRITSLILVNEYRLSNILVINTCYKHMGDQYIMRYEKMKRAFHNLCKTACTRACVINIKAQSGETFRFLCTANVFFDEISTRNTPC